MLCCIHAEVFATIFCIYVCIVLTHFVIEEDIAQDCCIAEKHIDIKTNRDM